ncbi:class I SAM-dependent methyltransferase [Seonamhaeicola maritimus]|uniref:class I SAM-dependent methyltransferase n=1 Tax=Seonamhaeicola maritimus TaxID=2591822 RepID=UPI002494E714|nr:class I SAM-dependent methyltransferase [Seonamhaeicola maritimus]
MTRYELMRWLTFPIMPVHLRTVRNDIKTLLKSHRKGTSEISILDVGGRKSPYSIRIPAQITLLDIPQEGDIRESLNLGFTSEILNSIRKKRSNIKNLIIEDMTKSTLPDASYDAVVCIEVIEHVEEDAVFVKNISKVLGKNGWAYFTTPNGDFIKNEGPNKNPDHVRHYTRVELQQLLETCFDKVEVHYAVKTGKCRLWGLKSFKLSRPLTLIRSILGNIINGFQSKGVQEMSKKTAHLVAIGYK